MPGQLVSVGELVSGIVGTEEGSELMEGLVLGTVDNVGKFVAVVGAELIDGEELGRAERDGDVDGILLIEGLELGSTEIDGCVDGIVLSDGFELGAADTVGPLDGIVLTEGDDEG